MFSLKKLSLLLLSVLVANSALAEQPMLQHGKKTVFQRVVSNPGAVLYKDVDGKDKIRNPRTFTSFYLYEKKGGNGKSWCFIQQFRRMDEH